MDIILRPMNLSRPSARDIRNAMELLRKSNTPQTTENIKIALQELDRAFKDQVGKRG